MTERERLKAGDKVWLLLEKIMGGYEIVESKCVQIIMSETQTLYSMYIQCDEINNTLEFYGDSDLCKTVFLSKEEAEKALREREK